MERLHTSSSCPDWLHNDVTSESEVIERLSWRASFTYLVTLTTLTESPYRIYWIFRGDIKRCDIHCSRTSTSYYFYIPSSTNKYEGIEQLIHANSKGCFLQICPKSSLISCSKPSALKTQIPQTNYGGGGKQAATIIHSSITSKVERGENLIPARRPSFKGDVPAMKCGVLHKRVLKENGIDWFRWKPCFFELCEGTMRYRKSLEDLEILGSLVLSAGGKVFACKEDEDEGRACFRIEINKQGMMGLSASSGEERDDWISSVTNHFDYASRGRK